MEFLLGDVARPFLSFFSAGGEEETDEKKELSDDVLDEVIGVDEDDGEDMHIGEDEADKHYMDTNGKEEYEE